ncbi:MAG: PEP-CTERM sorting domain-containing protein, partial [Roseofilum sp. SID1]
SGVSRFKVTDIDYFIGNTEETYFPIQLAFDKNVGSFKMRPIVTEEETKKQKVPESNSVWGLIGLGAFGVWKFMGLRKRKE